MAFLAAGASICTVDAATTVSTLEQQAVAALPIISYSYTPAPAARPRVGITLPLGKCVNMGSMLDKAVEGSFGQRPLADGDFPIIRAAGFSSVRIPINFTAHALPVAPYTIDPAFMARVRHVVDGATAAGLNAIVDMHRFDDMNADPIGNTQRFAALWRQIGDALADEPGTVWFELLNEPKRMLNNDNLEVVMRPAIDAVRARNPTRPIIIGGQHLSHVDGLATFTMPADPYVVPTIHDYDPIAFTHQGSRYMNPAPPLGRRFGTASDYAEIDADLALVRAYMKRTGRVPFVGEFGAIDYAAIPAAERVNYLGAVSAAFASIGVQSCVWAYANTFRIYDGDHWIPGVIDSLQTTTTKAP